MPFLTVADLQVFKPSLDPAKAAAMIEDASAMALGVAPCIATSDDPSVLARVKAVLRGAILRWEDSGSGAYTSRSLQMGPHGQTEVFDSRVHRSGLFWPDEITTLQGLCASAAAGGAFMIDLMPPASDES